MWYYKDKLDNSIKMGDLLDTTCKLWPNFKIMYA